MIEAHAHFHLRDPRPVRHKDARITHRVVQQRLVARVERDRHDGRRVQLQRGREQDGLHHGAGVEHADEVTPAGQRRQVGFVYAQTTATRGHRHRVIVKRPGRKICAPDVEFHGLRVSGNADRQIRRGNRHVYEVKGEPVRLHRANRAVGVQVLRFQPERQRPYDARRAQRIVGHRKQPDAQTFFAREIPQAARAVGVDRIDRLALAMVLINIGVFTQRRAPMVVEHGKSLAVTQRAEQVPRVFVEVGIGQDHHAAQRHRFDRQAEHQRHSWVRRAAVRHHRRDGNSRHNQVAVRVARTERVQTEHRKERIFRRHLVFGFDADIVNVALTRIGKCDEFRSAPAARLSRAGYGHGIQTEQTWVLRNIQINVRLAARGIVEVVLPHAQARHRVGRRQERHERRVGVRRRVGDHVKMPLVRDAIGHPQQGRVGPHVLAQQKLA